MLDWARESKALRPHVYPFTPQPGHTFAPDDAYLDVAADISMQRLGAAAARLAGWLNALYCGPVVTHDGTP